MKKLTKNQRGDTIVEVLISIAVVSLVLSAAYALANRSTQATRQSQERGEALKYAEEQMEKVKTYLSLQGDNSIVVGDHFCITQKATGELEVKKIDNPVTDANDCAKGPDNRYKMSVSVTDNHIYTVSSTWDKISGEGQDELTLAYKIPPTKLANIYDIPSTPSPTTPNPSPPADDDGDGISNEDDDCPNTSGVDEANGCPILGTQNGSDFTSCIPVTFTFLNPTQCTRNTPSVYDCGNYTATYTTAGFSLPSNTTYKLRINYKDVFCPPSTIPNPPASTGYKFNLTIRIKPSVSSFFPEKEYNISASPDSTYIDVDVPEFNPGEVVQIYWSNNKWVPDDLTKTYDPDFQIDSIQYIGMER